MIELPSRQLISLLESQITEQETTIGELMSKISGQEDAISDLQNRLTTQESTIADLMNQVTGQESTINMLLARLSDQEDTINDLMTQLDEQQDAITDLQDRVTWLEQHGGGGGGGGPTIPPDAVLWMAEDEGGGSIVKDESQYGNNGTVYGNPTWATLPSGVWYLTFDGDDYVNFGNNASLQPTNAFTVAFWMNPITLRSWSTVLGKTTGTSWNDGFGIYAYGSSLRFWINWYQTNFVYAQPIALGAWQQIVFVFDRSLPDGNMQIYLNGVLVSTRTYTNPVIATNGSFLFGQTDNSGQDYTYKGSMAMLRIFNRAWTTSEAQDSFNEEKQLFGL